MPKYLLPFEAEDIKFAAMQRDTMRPIKSKKAQWKYSRKRKRMRLSVKEYKKI